MVFVIVQIHLECRILKNWFGCAVPEQLMLVDLYSRYAPGQSNNSTAVPDEFAITVLHCSLGHSKHDLVRVSSDVPIGEAVSTLGQFIDFNVSVGETAQATATATTVGAFTILLQGTKNRTFLLKKWR